jgi:hypothetical protein
MVAPTLARLAAELLTLAMSVVAQPEDARCPDRAALVAATLPRVPEEAAHWRLHYRVAAAPDTPRANEVRLLLFDESGRMRLRRELTITDAGCAAATEGIVLILERFFEEVSWTGAVPLPEMERQVEPASLATASWELQAAVAMRREVALVPGLALDARIPLAAVWLLQTGLIVQPTPVSQALSPGEARLWSLPLRTSFRGAVEHGRLRLELGPQVTVTAEQAHTSGLENSSAGRLVGAVGAVGSERWAFSTSWVLALDLSAELTVLGPPFMVTGLQHEVLTPRRIQILGMVGIAHAFSR